MSTNRFQYRKGKESNLEPYWCYKYSICLFQGKYIDMRGMFTLPVINVLWKITVGKTFDYQVWYYFINYIFYKFVLDKYYFICFVLYIHPRNRSFHVYYLGITSPSHQIFLVRKNTIRWGRGGVVTPYPYPYHYPAGHF